MNLKQNVREKFSDYKVQESIKLDKDLSEKIFNLW